MPEEKNSSPPKVKPPLSPVRIVCQIIFSAAAAGVVAGVSYFCMMFILPWERDHDWGVIGDVNWCILLVTVIFLLVSLIAVYFIGILGNQKGSFWATLAGSFLGGLFAAASFFFLVSISDPIIIFVFILPTIGATIGFNLTRKYRTPPVS